MSEPTVKTIRLYGHLRKRFGKEFRLAVNSVHEATSQALPALVPGWTEYVGVTHGQSGFRVLVGEEPQTIDTLGNPVGSNEVIKIVPVVAGAKSGGMQFLFGAILVAASFIPVLAPVSGYMRSMGIAMMVGGVATMLATAPNLAALNSNNGPADSPAYSFGNPTVTIGQGRPVPLLYGGPLRVGGAIVSAGINSEAYQRKGFGGAALDDLGTISGNGDSLPWLWAIAPAV